MYSEILLEVISYLGTVAAFGIHVLEPFCSMFFSDPYFKDSELMFSVLFSVPTDVPKSSSPSIGSREICGYLLSLGFCQTSVGQIATPPAGPSLDGSESRG